MGRRNLFLAITLNLIVVTNTIIGMIMLFCEERDTSIFLFYTNDSNILAGLACGIYVFYAVFGMLNKTYDIPKWVGFIKYMAVCCLSLTFLISATTLAPIYTDGYFQFFFNDTFLFFHFLNPILTTISFIFFDNIMIKNMKSAFWALIPTIIYSLVIISLNISKSITGPYPFLEVYNQPIYISVIWVVVIFGLVFATALALYGIKKIIHPKLISNKNIKVQNDPSAEVMDIL